MRRAGLVRQFVSAGLVAWVLLIWQNSPAWSQAQGQGTVSLPSPNTPGALGPAPSTSMDPLPVTENIRLTGPNDNTQAEISMAASGQNIVITFNDFSGNGVGYVTSTDGGMTFTTKTSPPVPPGASPCCDPGVVSDLAANFYITQIFGNDGTNHCTNSVHVSTDGGVTFSTPVGAAFSYAFGTTDFPDMPHPGIDRINTVAGHPQLYVYTRHFTSGLNCPLTGGSGFVQGEIVCSVDGGVTWSTPFVFPTFTDTAHIATARDGRIYVVGNSFGTMANTTKIVLWRSTTTGCTAPGALSFTGPTTVADNLTFGPTGVDREFPQPYVVVDQTNSDRVYAAWSSDSATNNGDRDIFLAQCDFPGGCGSPITVNSDTTGAQFFPMLCINPNNRIFLSWDDRRSGPVQIFQAEITQPGLVVSPNLLVSEVGFTPFDFPGTPDYGDYNENNQACDADHFYVAWSSQVSPPEITPPSTDVDVFFAAVTCPLTQGFWKNKPSAWPVTVLTLGSQTYAQAELLTILTTPVGSRASADASLILAHQLIAAKLNIANGSDSIPISATIAAADTLLSGFTGKLPYGVKPSSVTGQAMVNNANTLNDYDTGQLTPSCIP